jgi:ATP-dependent protease ClpP protease subunit
MFTLREIIKHFFGHAVLITMVIIAAVLMGCGTMDQQVVKHQLEISVVSDQGVDMIMDAEEPGDPMLYEPLNNPYMELSQLSSMDSAGQFVFIKMFSGLSVSDVTRLWNDIMYTAYETDIKTIKMFINSPGGDAFSGLALADLIIKAQEEFGITFEAHANGIIASAAVPVFAVCKKRYAASGTIFMVHEAALWKWPGRESASDIRSQNELMIMLQDRYLSYLVGNSNLDLAKWQEMEKATTWFNAEKALEIGLVDEIK